MKMSSKKMRTVGVICLILVVLLAVALMGCQSGTNNTPAAEPPQSGSTNNDAPATDGAPLQVAFLISNMSNEFMQGLVSSVEMAGTERGVEVTSFSADFDFAKQVSQIETAVNQGFDGIIVDAAQAEAVVPAIKYAQEAGIPIITLHEDATEGVADAFVGVNFVQGGQMKMEQCVKDLGGEGDIAIMYGGMGHEAQILISAGYYPVLEANPGINVIFEDTGNWAAEDAAALTESWLASGKALDAIVCNNDGMAVGVISVLRAADLAGKIKVYGLDAASEMLTYISEGYANATILTDRDGEGRAGIDIIIKMVNGEPYDKLVLIDMILITPENVKDFM